MKIQDLKDLLSSNQFHHATYRSQGTVWEGLYIYRRSINGFRGFELAGCFNANDNPELNEAMALCKSISLGSYGSG